MYSTGKILILFGTALFSGYVISLSLTVNCYTVVKGHRWLFDDTVIDDDDDDVTNVTEQ
jgi:hypothetical protein